MPSVGAWSRSDPTSAWKEGAPDTCPEVFFVGARGSSQNDKPELWMGEQVARLFHLYRGEMVAHDHRTTDSSRRVATAPLGLPQSGYPAVPAPPLGSTFAQYEASVQAGTGELFTQLNRLAARCGPTTRFVLAGFSQGAQVVHRAVRNMSQQFFESQIAAVVLIADPTCAPAQTGVRYFGFRYCEGALASLGVPSWAASRTTQVCRTTDGVCNSVPNGHASYDVPTLQPVAEWAASKTPAVSGTPRCGGEYATHVGTTGNDTITGKASRHSVIYGGSGADVLRGGAADDLLCGGPGNDTLDGGGGSNRCYGQGGTDTFKNCQVIVDPTDVPPIEADYPPMRWYDLQFVADNGDFIASGLFNAQRTVVGTDLVMVHSTSRTFTTLETCCVQPGAAITPDGKFALYSAAGLTALVRRNIPAGTTRTYPIQSTNGWLFPLHLSSDGALATVDKPGLVDTIDLRTGNVTYERDGASSQGFSASGQYEAWVSSLSDSTATVALRDDQSGSVRSFAGDPCFSVPQFVIAVANDGSTVGALRCNGALGLLNPSTGRMDLLDTSTCRPTIWYPNDQFGLSSNATRMTWPCWDSASQRDHRMVVIDRANSESAWATRTVALPNAMNITGSFGMSSNGAWLVADLCKREWIQLPDGQGAGAQCEPESRGYWRINLETGVAEEVVHFLRSDDVPPG